MVLMGHSPPKIAIGSNPPLTEDFKKSPIPLSHGGIPTMSNVGQFSKVHQDHFQKLLLSSIKSA